MKITTFNPLIVTKDPKPVIELFEALGFERRHTTRRTHELTGHQIYYKSITKRIFHP